MQQPKPTGERAFDTALPWWYDNTALMDAYGGMIADVYGETRHRDALGNALRRMPEMRALLADMINGIDAPHTPRHMPMPAMGWEEWITKVRELLANV